VNSEKQHGFLIVVARLRFSCSLLSTFGARILKKTNILEEISFMKIAIRMMVVVVVLAGAALANAPGPGPMPPVQLNISK
jgi:hypothetical protein